MRGMFCHVFHGRKVNVPLEFPSQGNHFEEPSLEQDRFLSQYSRLPTAYI